jgi:hypothetical protein
MSNLHFLPIPEPLPAARMSREDLVASYHIALHQALERGDWKAARLLRLRLASLEPAPALYAKETAG